MDEDSLDYFELREQQEREAARTAVSDAARRAHEELAKGYAVLVREAQQLQTTLIT